MADLRAKAYDDVMVVLAMKPPQKDLQRVKSIMLRTNENYRVGERLIPRKDLLEVKDMGINLMKVLS